MITLDDETKLILFLVIPVGTLLVGLFYYFTIYPAVRKFILRKRGVRLTADVVLSEKTLMKQGDDSFATPIYKLGLTYVYNDKKYQITKYIAFSDFESRPEAGQQTAIIIDPEKPKRLMLASKF